MESLIRSFLEDVPSRYTRYIRWVAAVFVFVGLIVNAEPPLPALLVAFGLAGFVFSFEADNRSLAKKLLDHMLPDRFADLPVARTKFAEAIRELVEFYSRQHEGGLVPLVEDLQGRINVCILVDTEHERYKIPDPPNGCKWRWFRFHIETSWFLSPPRLTGRGYQRVAKPGDFLGEVIVMSYPAYAKLLAFSDPRRDVYYPLATPVCQAVLGESSLASVSFLTSVDRDGKTTPELHYVISKHTIGTTGNRPLVSDPVRLELRPCLAGLKENRRREEIKRAFPGLEHRRRILDDACEGVFEIYRYADDNDPALSQLWIREDENRCWKFSTAADYILPAKLVRDGDVVWDQQMFLFPFTRLTTVRTIQFTANTDKISFGGFGPPSLLTYPALVGSAQGQDGGGVELSTEGLTWTVAPGGDFHFPGDVILFWWHDTLVKELLEQ